MVVAETLTPYMEWKQHFLSEIDGQPHSVAKGDAFVHKVLRIYYNLSEEDAIDATECAGAGDRGIDAVYIIPAEEGDVPHALVVQGKYGAARTNLQIYPEAKKFLSALKDAQKGLSTTPAVAKVAGILNNGGSVHYILATIEPVALIQQEQLADIKKVAYADFGDRLALEAINLENIYTVLVAGKHPKTVGLPCRVVSVTDGVYVGVAKLTDMYGMLCSYAKQDGGIIDSIYDLNIRKYLKRRTGSVNDGSLQNSRNSRISLYRFFIIMVSPLIAVQYNK